MSPEQNTDFFGRGLRHPMRLGAAGVQESGGVAKVEESIRIILGTRHGERVMRPGFGSDLGTLVFAPNNTATANLARYHVEDALARHEPRIEVVDVAVTNDRDRGRLHIDITYRLRATRDVHTLSVPFGLEPQS
ncbi:GPW/gp25 family protein [Actinoplanes sp. LDG1-06]|uniref:GPW/gp25 family protein n=1 Tax=Paractinoplanes ovalisporus TaxID=2810368 RepID=A0ABS2A2C9_9ACTN|nr:GPW/gp25 family protein [Actinoplanes ovalisporus]MBM2613997.1 GPW/gp25 family protein [Actinoplanes ovalisporus]